MKKCLSFKVTQRDNHTLKTGIAGFDELVDSLPKGGLIVVSGTPGTGKTAFATAFIHNGAVKFGEPGVYASLIEDEKSFNEYMKNFGYDFAKLRVKNLFRYIALPTLLEPGVTTAMNHVLEVVSSINAKRLVIDSYTALNQMFKRHAEARVFLHTLVSKIVKKLGCTMILIKEEQTSEKKEYEFQEFVADVVIHLKTNRLEGKLLRELTIVKLRGAEVKFPDACFTLHGGFRIFPPFRGKLTPVKYKPPEDPPGKYTTGLPDLDREIGGYPKGSTILIEIDPKLTPMEYGLVVAPVLASFILKGRSLVVIPSGGVIPDFLEDMFRLYGISRQEFLERCHIFYEKGVPIRKPPNVIEFEPKPVEEATRRIIEFTVKLTEKTGKPPIVLLGIDRIVHLGGGAALDQLSVAQDCVRAHNKLMIWLLKPTRPWIRERLAPIADIHLKIMRRHGCILFYGIKPRTSLYALEIMAQNPIPKLVPIT